VISTGGAALIPTCQVGRLLTPGNLDASKNAPARGPVVVDARNGAPRRAIAPDSHVPWQWLLVCGLVLLSYYAALAALQRRGEHEIMGAAVVSGTAYWALPLLWPASAPRRILIICPINWAHVAFFLQLVAIPALICVAGASLGPLPELPLKGFINQALLISTLSYACFCGGCQLASKKKAVGTTRQATPTRRLIAMFGVIGGIGLYYRFGHIGDLLSYFREPALWTPSEQESATLRSAASTFLRPFLLCAVIMVWCRWIDTQGRKSSSAVQFASVPIVSLPAVMVGMTFDFNRAMFVAPVVALLAAYSVRIRPISISVLLAGVLLFATPLAMVGGYRMDAGIIDDMRGGYRSTISELGVLDQLQIYGGGPQFLGFLLQNAAHMKPWSPSVLAAALLYPIPIVGKAARGYSAVAQYNQMIYGQSDTLDQIVPFQGELYVTLGFAGIVAAFVALGYVIASLQRKYISTANAFTAYATQYSAIWISFLVLGSLEATWQTFVYFFWPFYAYIALRVLQPRLFARPLLEASDWRAKEVPRLAGEGMIP
jgi:hypothetical protein